VNPDSSFTVDTFINLEKYKIKGLEGAYQQQLRFLPKPFDGLGLIASLTYISTADLPWKATDGTIYNLPILPKITASGTIYYEKGPVSARASYTYKGERFNGTNQNNGIDIQNWESPRSYLDASVGYKFAKWLEVRIEGQNLTNTRTYVFGRQVDGLYGDENSRVDNAYQAGRTFSFGIRGSF
jgi:iron complex outermembrane recepter protein